MENSRKTLKNWSFLILFLTALSAIRLIVEVFMLDFNPSELPEGTSKGMFIAAQIIVIVIGLIILLPEVFVGVRGIQISKNPDFRNGHITWSKVIIVLSAIALISPISGLIKGERIATNILEVIDLLSDVAVFYLFIVFSKRVASEA